MVFGIEFLDYGMVQVWMQIQTRLIHFNQTDQ